MVTIPDEPKAKGDSPRIGLSGNANESVIVPIGDFLDVISEKTGWSHQKLLTEKDIGDVEVQLKVKAKRPLQLKIIKRGKSRNDLYKFVSLEARKWNQDLVTTLIKK